MLTSLAVFVLILAACGTDVERELGGASNTDAGDGSASSELAFTTQCGAVVFPPGPIDVDGFELADDAMMTIIDSVRVLVSEEWPVATWSVASRTDDRIVLFARGPLGVSRGTSMRRSS